ncbi:hypothetical protein D3C77_418870 [compost metagenome]
MLSISASVALTCDSSGINDAHFMIACGQCAAYVGAALRRDRARSNRHQLLLGLGLRGEQRLESRRRPSNETQPLVHDEIGGDVMLLGEGIAFLRA